jgi:hypothetical protein
MWTAGGAERAASLTLRAIDPLEASEPVPAHGARETAQSMFSYGAISVENGRDVQESANGPRRS